jgi:hypothetical protein
MNISCTRKEIIKYFCIRFFIVSIIASYYISGITFLIIDFDNFTQMLDICNSRIWYYVLLSMVIMLDKIYYRKNSHIETSFKTYTVIAIVDIALAVCGGYELFGHQYCIENNNNEYFYTPLFRFGITNFLLQIIIIIIQICNILVFLCNKKKHTQVANIDNSIVIEMTDIENVFIEETENVGVQMRINNISNSNSNNNRNSNRNRSFVIVDHVPITESGFSTQNKTKTRNFYGELNDILRQESEI